MAGITASPTTEANHGDRIAQSRRPRMNAVLVDSSAWVEYDRATGSPADLVLTQFIADDASIVVTEPVILEVCAGARTTSRESDLRRLLTRFSLAPFDSVADFNGAVSIYRQCRSAGVTPRGMVDCMIASVALRHSAQVLAWDRDFARVAEVVDLGLHASSLR